MQSVAGLRLDEKSKKGSLDKRDEGDGEIAIL